MRIVAARIVAAMKVSGVSGELVQALAREQDPRIGAEMLRALFLLDDPAAMAGAEAYLKQGHPEALLVYARMLATRSPAGFARELPAIATALGNRAIEWLLPSIRLAVERNPALRQQILLTALRATSAESWPHLMADVSLAGTDVDVIVKALESANADVREGTVWTLLAWRQGGLKLPDDVERAASQVIAQPGNVTWEQYGREVMARLIAKTGTTDWAAWLRAQPIEIVTRWGDPAAMRRVADALPSSERTVLRRILDSLDSGISRHQWVRAPSISDRPNPAEVRTPSMLWPGFLSSLMAASHCPIGGEWSIGGVKVKYGVSGRPENASIARGSLPDRCLDTLRVLGQIALADDRDGSRMVADEWIVLPRNSEFVRCTDGPLKGRLPRAAELRTEFEDFASGRRPLAPKVLQSVAPQYPESAQDTRTGGTVIVQGTLSSAGCISSAAIGRGVAAALDMAAIQAVTKWRFSPVQLDGQPQATEIAVMFSYNLH
ncbi:MAG: TonB family protein [Vicinamibacterales bacterium]